MINLSIFIIMLNRLHNELYGSDEKYNPIDVEHYTKQVKNVFSSNPVFCSLSKKYTLEHFSITEKDIAEKYIHLYIFLEYVYQRVRSDSEEKFLLYDRINHLGDDNNFFGYLKIYTVYYSTCIVRKFNNSFILRVLSSLFLMLNIFEAVIEDLFNLQFISSFVGFCIALMVPFHVCNFSRDKNENILCDMTDKWINAYTSWNIRFTYSDSPGKNYFPRTSICLFNSFQHKNEWLNNRAYVLFASHVLKSVKSFNQTFGLEDVVNKKLLSDWNKANVRYIFELKL